MEPTHGNIISYAGHVEGRCPSMVSVAIVGASNAQSYRKKIS